MNQKLQEHKHFYIERKTEEYHRIQSICYVIVEIELLILKSSKKNKDFIVEKIKSIEEQIAYLQRYDCSEEKLGIVYNWSLNEFIAFKEIFNDKD